MICFYFTLTFNFWKIKKMTSKKLKVVGDENVDESDVSDSDSDSEAEEDIADQNEVN